MTVRRFWSSQPVTGHRAVISGDELHHLRTVNRAVQGDAIEVFDGRGVLASGIIASIEHHEAVVEIRAREVWEKPPPRLIIAPSLTKKRNMALMMEKLSELGADQVVPIICERTDEKYSPSMLEKWERIALQSLKVNKRPWVTEISPPVRLEKLAQQFDGEDIPGLSGSLTRTVLHAEGKPLRPGEIKAPMLCIIGPPGGFTETERQSLRQQGYVEIKINDGILKTETAAISIAAILTGVL